MVTLPHAAARTAVPLGAAMSMPSCWRPQRGPNSEVTVPLTGVAMVDDPQLPPSGVVDRFSETGDVGAGDGFVGDGFVGAGDGVADAGDVASGAAVGLVAPGAGVVVGAAASVGCPVAADPPTCRPAVWSVAAIRSLTFSGTFEPPTAEPCSIS